MHSSILAYKTICNFNVLKIILRFKWTWKNNLKLTLCTCILKQWNTCWNYEPIYPTPHPLRRTEGWLTIFKTLPQPPSKCCVQNLGISLRNYESGNYGPAPVSKRPVEVPRVELFWQSSHKGIPAAPQLRGENSDKRSYNKYSDHINNIIIFTLVNLQKGQYLNRGSYMSAHQFLNLLNELGKKIRCEALPSILSIFQTSTNAKFYLSCHT